MRLLSGAALSMSHDSCGRRQAERSPLLEVGFWGANDTGSRRREATLRTSLAIQASLDASQVSDTLGFAASCETR